jgi:hypothetical protein
MNRITGAGFMLLDSHERLPYRFAAHAQCSNQFWRLIRLIHGTQEKQFKACNASTFRTFAKRKIN